MDEHKEAHVWTPPAAFLATISPSSNAASKEMKSPFARQHAKKNQRKKPLRSPNASSPKKQPRRAAAVDPYALSDEDEEENAFISKLLQQAQESPVAQQGGGRVKRREEMHPRVRLQQLTKKRIARVHQEYHAATRINNYARVFLAKQHLRRMRQLQDEKDMNEEERNELHESRNRAAKARAILLFMPKEQRENYCASKIQSYIRGNLVRRRVAHQIEVVTELAKQTGQHDFHDEKIVFPDVKDADIIFKKIGEAKMRCANCKKASNMLSNSSKTTSSKQKINLLSCNTCAAAFYCSKECAWSHWKTHAKDCVHLYVALSRAYRTFQLKVPMATDHPEKAQSYLDSLVEHKKNCAYCGKATRGKSGKPLIPCNQCKSVSYCSQKCTTTHFHHGHYLKCKQLRTNRKNAVNVIEKTSQLSTTSPQARKASRQSIAMFADMNKHQRGLLNDFDEAAADAQDQDEPIAEEEEEEEAL